MGLFISDVIGTWPCFSFTRRHSPGDEVMTSSSRERLGTRVYVGFMVAWSRSLCSFGIPSKPPKPAFVEDTSPFGVWYTTDLGTAVTDLRSCG